MTDVPRTAHTTATPIGVMWGYETSITHADDAFLGIIGYTRDDLQQGRIDWAAMTPPEFLELDRAGIRQAAVSGGFTAPYQKEFFRKDGSRVPVLLVCAFVPDRPGEWMGYVVDLTPERRIAAPADPKPIASILPIPEEFYRRLVGELVKERTHLRAMLDTTNTPICSMDLEGRLLAFNDAFQQAQRQATGHTLQVGDRPLSADLPEEIRRERAAWYARAFAGETVNVQGEQQVGNEMVHHEQKLLPMRDTDGTIFGITIVAHDVTERVKHERALEASRQLFHTLASGSPLGVFFTGQEGDCQYVNDRLAEIWGLPPEELLGSGWGQRVHPDDIAQLTEQWQQAQVAGSDLQADYRLLMPEGDVRFVRLWIMPLHERGRCTGFVGSVEDFTDRRVLQLRTQQRERLESLGTLAGGIAHDFNNMLGVILAQSQLALLEPGNAEQQQESIAEIRDASLRARELIKQIMVFSKRPDRPGTEEVDLCALTKDTARFLVVTLPRQLRFTVDVPEQPVLIAGNATALQQAIVNLCMNAEHALRSREQPSLELTLTLVPDPEKPLARLAVRDNGSGMSASVAARIFEPFFTTKGVGDGTGLGLSVVHGTVQAHGGDITVESTVGAGTTFVVTLPLA